jgi:excisionase family DNA binding protein
MDIDNQDQLLKPQEAAELLRVSDRTLRRLRRENQLPCIRIGNCIRYDKADLNAFVQSLKQQATTSLDQLQNLE